MKRIDKRNRNGVEMFWVEHQVLAVIFVLVSPFILMLLLCAMEWIGERSDFLKRAQKRFGFDDSTSGHINKGGNAR